MRNKLIKLAQFSVVFVLLLFVAASKPDITSAQVYCGGTNTANKCGAAGGCGPGMMCQRNGCVSDPACVNADNSQKTCGDNGTNGNCGPAAGCVNGTMCKVEEGWFSRNTACVADNTTLEKCGPAPMSVNYLECGAVVENNRTTCKCPNSDSSATEKPIYMVGTNLTRYCCGSPSNGVCYLNNASRNAAQAAANPPNPPAAPPAAPAVSPSPSPSDPLDIFAGPNSQTFRELNPLKTSPFSRNLSSPGGIVSRLLVFAFPLAGLILFAMIVWGGFEMITNAASSKSMEAGKQRITAAIVGFMLLFVAYWIFQIVEEIFGIVIL